MLEKKYKKNDYIIIFVQNRLFLNIFMLLTIFNNAIIHWKYAWPTPMTLQKYYNLKGNFNKNILYMS